MRLVYHRDENTPTRDQLLAGDLLHLEPLERY